MNHTIPPCLWFDNQVEEAVAFYISIFNISKFKLGESKIESISRYGKEGFEFHGQKEGTAMTVFFQLNGQSFVAFNAGPAFKFDETVSFQIYCDSQEEIDYYWNKLSEGGEECSCGWLKDKFGLSWQVVPSTLAQRISDPAKRGQVTDAFM